jgi:hypothetical protein
MRDHRLVPVRGQVDDRQAAVAEADPAVLVYPDSIVIRPTMRDLVGHRTNQSRFDSAARKQAGYTAHCYSLCDWTDRL